MGVMGIYMLWFVPCSGNIAVIPINFDKDAVEPLSCCCDSCRSRTSKRIEDDTMWWCDKPAEILQQSKRFDCRVMIMGTVCSTCSCSRRV